MAANINFLEGGMTDINNRQLGIVMVNNWLWTKGRHTFNFGVQFRRTYQDIIACQFCSGTFNFSQRTTSIPNTNDPNFGSYGSSFASFLLGDVDSVERITSNEVYFRNKEFASYVQDDIKVNKRLSLNLGLRWDVMVPFTEEDNQIVYVNVLTSTRSGRWRNTRRRRKIRQRNHPRAYSLEELAAQGGLCLQLESQDCTPVRLLPDLSGWRRL